jgi:hypothetical protein
MPIVALKDMQWMQSIYTTNHGFLYVTILEMKSIFFDVQVRDRISSFVYICWLPLC